MMTANDIHTMNDAQRYCEGVINDFEAGISTKEETMDCLNDYTFRLHELFWKNALIKIRKTPELLKEK